MKRQSAERASRWNDRAPPSSAIRKKKNKKRKKKENIPAGSVASAGGLWKGRGGGFFRGVEALRGWRHTEGWGSSALWPGFP